MCNSDQPEYYKGKFSISGPYEYPYWNLVLQFVITGELSKAWTLLSYHSGCRYAEEEAINADTELSELGEGFAALRSLLMAAPLPGGRGDMYSDDAGLDDYLEEELLEKGEDEGINYEENDVEDPGGSNSSELYDLIKAMPRQAGKPHKCEAQRPFPSLDGGKWLYARKVYTVCEHDAARRLPHRARGRRPHLRLLRRAGRRR